ncbi:uncharacterized protein [Branchiostoma lanceolatum]|uniref:uncharacterized protein n=1 Tax=Branchiostoma lanceolatum TaxID=7740 RepID=UPI00345609C3
MVHTCAAVGCHNRKNTGCPESFYRFPRDEPRRGRWIAAVKREDWLPTDSSRLCSTHFISGKKSDDTLSPDYVPSLFAYVSSPVKRKRNRDFEIFQQRQKVKIRRKEQAKTDQDAVSALHNPMASVSLPAQDTVASASSPVSALHNPMASVSLPAQDTVASASSDPVEMDSRHTSATGEKPVDYATECENLRLENYRLREKIESLSLTEQVFMANSEKVKFYTGLPNYNVFNAVLTLISSHMTERRNTKLSHFQQLLITLMKLRLNIFHQDLAYRFGVHMSTISRTVHQVVDLLYALLVPTAVIWPDREELRKTLPMAFRGRYGKCVAIIDCFEVTLEKSSDQEAQSQTYSSYKSRNTLKYLIAIAPQGVITFISKGWGGRTSDKSITEKSGFIKKLLPGDQVLADRGFDIKGTLATYGASLSIPPFTRGKK